MNGLKTTIRRFIQTIYGITPRFGSIVLPPLHFISSLFSFLWVPLFHPCPPSTFSSLLFGQVILREREKKKRERSLSWSRERVICNKQWADSLRMQQLEYNRLCKLTYTDPLLHTMKSRYWLYLFPSTTLPPFPDSFFFIFFISHHWSLNDW